MCRVVRLPVLVLCLVLSAPGLASPMLQCRLAQGGETQTLVFEPTVDPYREKAVDIAGRFRFKAVVFSERDSIAYVKLYAYYRGARQAVLLHQATYRDPPLDQGQAVRSLTGEQRLFSPDLGHELQYDCALLGSQR